MLTGKFTWAWDMGRPGVNTEPAEGEQYTRGTPNVWTLMSYDDALGLVYAPTGNSTPDFFGAHRSDASEKYASSVVALDVTDGSVRWSFQTVHHDIWDYDVPSQPTLVDLPQTDGSVVPALVQPTKRGELFLLDRRTGTPIAEVEERRCRKVQCEYEWLSKTQPFSVGMPSFRPDVSEADMWGLTPFDQMWCRREFHKMRYEGHFTPPSVEGTFVFPGNAGGFNWGGVAVDEENQLLVATPLIMGSRLALVPRDKVPKEREALPAARHAVRCRHPDVHVTAANAVHAAAVWTHRCRRPADATGSVEQAPGYDERERTVGPESPRAPADGRAARGGLDRHAGRLDLLRRRDGSLLPRVRCEDRRELWRDYLPAPAQATPMSYLSPQTKRQIVVITVPGAGRFGMAESEDKSPPDPLGGHIIAYALPPG